MRLEMEGKEPFIVLFGVPLVTAVIVLAAVHFGQLNTRIVPPPPITVEGPKVTPRITAEFPQGTIQITNAVPPAQIHEVIKEVVRVPDVHVTNQVESKTPEVHVTLPPGALKGGETTVLAVPTPVPMLTPRNVSTDDAPQAKNGKLLPPPKGGETPAAR